MGHLDTCTQCSHCEMLPWANISCPSNIHYFFTVKSFRFLIALEIWLSSILSNMIVTGCVITHQSLLLLLCRIFEYFNQLLHIYSTIHMNFLPFVVEFFLNLHYIRIYLFHIWMIWFSTKSISKSIKFWSEKFNMTLCHGMCKYKFTDLYSGLANCAFMI